MSDVARDAHQEFWRPPLSEPTKSNLAEACPRCGSEFMVGAAFCHLCGSNRHQAEITHPGKWTRHLTLVKALEFSRIKDWFGLPLASLLCFLAGVACLIVAFGMVFVDWHDATDFEALQLWRIQWMMLACAAFLAGILLKRRKSLD
jgi:hypothetical protein